MKHWLSAESAGLLGARRKWEHGDTVFHAHDPSQRVYILLEGVVEISHQLDTGQSLLMKLLVAPTFFGVIEVLGKESSCLETVRVLSGAETCSLDHGKFRSLISNDAGLCLEVLTDLGLTFCQSAKSESARLFPTENLLANMLLAYGELFGRKGREGIQIHLIRTQHDLAMSVGASERQVQRILRIWKDQGILSKSQSHFVIHDAQRLTEIAGQLAGTLIHRYPA